MSLPEEDVSPKTSAFFTPTQSVTGWNRVSTESVEQYFSARETKSECNEASIDTIDESIHKSKSPSRLSQDLLSVSDSIDAIEGDVLKRNKQSHVSQDRLSVSDPIDPIAPAVTKRKRHSLFSRDLTSDSLDPVSDLKIDSISSMDSYASIESLNFNFDRGGHRLSLARTLSRNISIVVNAMKNAPSTSMSISTVASRLSRLRTVRTLMSFTEGPGFDAGHWKSSTEYRLTAIGATVGLGNLWKFPALAYQHGGGAFLIPYIIMHTFVGVPLFFMSVSLGQFSGLSCLGAWNFQPAARGIGISMMLLSFTVSASYNVVLAYALYYAVVSFRATLPWSSCKDSWIGHDKFRCYLKDEQRKFSVCNNETLNATQCKCSGKIPFDFNRSNACFRNLYVYSELIERSNLTYCSGLQRCTNETKPPSFFFFYDDVLQKSDEIGKPVWHLTLSNLATWVIVVLCLSKGIHSAGKVTYFTVLFPYVFMTVLIISTVVNNRIGSLNGIKAFLIPSWEEITRLNVWITAMNQVFFSFGISLGLLICLSSYNPLNNNIYRDTLIITSVDLFTSLLAGIVVFMTLGGMAMDLDVPIKDIASGDSYGLVFVVYPEALALLGGSQQTWCFFFFLMLFTLGIDSQFCLVYTVAMAIQRYFNHIFKNPIYVLLIGTTISFVITLPYVTPAGVNMMEFFDRFVLGWPWFFVVLVQILVITWSYGANHLLCDIKHMVGYRIEPHFCWMFCYIYVCPVVLGLLLLASLWDHIKITHEYTIRLQIYGWFLSILTIAPIPCCYFYRLYNAPGEKLRHKIRAAHVPLRWRSQKFDSIYGRYGARGKEW